MDEELETRPGEVDVGLWEAIHTEFPELDKLMEERDSEYWHLVSIVDWVAKRERRRGYNKGYRDANVVSNKEETP